MPNPAKQFFYWKIHYSDGSFFPQFEEGGKENMFYQAVLKNPKEFENPDITKPLYQYEFRDDIVAAGWYVVIPEIAENNPICEIPKYIKQDHLVLYYGPDEKPFLMRTVKWTYTQEQQPHIAMYRIGRDGKTEYYLNKYGMVRKWEDSE